MADVTTFNVSYDDMKQLSEYINNILGGKIEYSVDQLEMANDCIKKMWENAGMADDLIDKYLRP